VLRIPDSGKGFLRGVKVIAEKREKSGKGDAAIWLFLNNVQTVFRVFA
jgi:hypothetical protein